MTAAPSPDALRKQILLFLEQHQKTDSPNFVGDEDLAAATSLPREEIQRQLDILEELGLTTTANSRDGRRARISAKGLLEAEQLHDTPAPQPKKPPIGFGS